MTGVQTCALPICRRTLAARLGRGGSLHIYRLLVLLPFALLGVIAASRPGALLALLALPGALGLARRLPAAHDAASLNGLLAGTAKTQLLFGLLFAIGVNL